MDPQSHPRKSQLRTILTMIASSGEVIKKQLIKIPWPYTILLSGLGWQAIQRRYIARKRYSD